MKDVTILTGGCFAVHIEDKGGDLNPHRLNPLGVVQASKFPGVVILAQKGGTKFRWGSNGNSPMGGSHDTVGGEKAG